MRIITKRRLLEAAQLHPDARSNIVAWHLVAKAAVWTNLVETRKSFRHADQVKVKSGRSVTVFNLAKSFRLITALHYDKEKIYILRFLTHAEYDKEKWKNEL